LSAAPPGLMVIELRRCPKALLLTVLARCGGTSGREQRSSGYP